MRWPTWLRAEPRGRISQGSVAAHGKDVLDERKDHTPSVLSPGVDPAAGRSADLPDTDVPCSGVRPDWPAGGGRQFASLWQDCPDDAGFLHFPDADRNRPGFRRGRALVWPARQPSTPRPIGSATPWNAASTCSNAIVPWPPDVTSWRCATAPPSTSPPSTSGYRRTYETRPSRKLPERMRSPSRPVVKVGMTFRRACHGVYAAPAVSSCPRLESFVVSDQPFKSALTPPSPGPGGPRGQGWRGRRALVWILSGLVVLLVVLCAPAETLVVLLRGGLGETDRGGAPVPGPTPVPTGSTAEWEAVTATGRVGDALVIQDGTGGQVKITVKSVDVRPECADRRPRHGSYLVAKVDVEVVEGPATLHAAGFAAVGSDELRSANIGPILSGCGGPNLPALRDAPTGSAGSGLLVFDAPGATRQSCCRHGGGGHRRRSGRCIEFLKPSRQVKSCNGYHGSPRCLTICIASPRSTRRAGDT
jgi:hypothetical protein